MSETYSIGVLSLQGGFSKHCEAINSLGHEAINVRHAEDLDRCQALILPGGESTTIGMLLKRRGLDISIEVRIARGMPVFGTCAGMILLASTVEGRKEVSFNQLPIELQRNAYGSQLGSFEASIDITTADITAQGFEKRTFSAVFIRAPKITAWSTDISVLAEFDGHPVLVQRGSILASCFHPELTDDRSIHSYFCSLIQTSPNP